MRTFTIETPIAVFRSDFLHRQAICTAAGQKWPELLPVGLQAGEMVQAIDANLTDRRRIEDDLVRTRALEQYGKLEVAEQYGLTRKQLAAYQPDDLFRYLPEPPFALARSGIKTFGERVSSALINLRTLPEAHPVRVGFLPELEQRFVTFQTADQAEDQVQHIIQGMRLAQVTFKAELATLREEQLGRILVVIKDREQLELFTLPTRKHKSNKVAGGELVAPGTEEDGEE